MSFSGQVNAERKKNTLSRPFQLIGVLFMTVFTPACTTFDVGTRPRYASAFVNDVRTNLPGLVYPSAPETTYVRTTDRTPSAPSTTSALAVVPSAKWITTPDPSLESLNETQRLLKCVLVGSARCEIDSKNDTL